MNTPHSFPPLRRVSRHIVGRRSWRGRLWQERFHPFVIDERYLLAAAQYVEHNPAKAGLCHSVADWPWSSARAHVRGEDDALVRVRPLLDLVPDWQQ